MKMQDESGVITADRFTIQPNNKKEIESFLNAHLGDSLIEIVSIDFYNAKCRVKTEGTEKVVTISLPVQITHN